MKYFTEEQAFQLLQKVNRILSRNEDANPYVLFNGRDFYVSEDLVDGQKAVLYPDQLKRYLEDLAEQRSNGSLLVIQSFHEEFDEFLFGEFGEGWFAEYQEQKI
ncbi:hypothetical protein [Bacillus sp. OTU530]|uniref:hypothetical protein n=1 Tax=Bacillus sp. OTU530 TaxID=3043862 RepID=UPI00313BA56F